MVEFKGVRYQGQVTVEAAVIFNAPPKLSRAEAELSDARILIEDLEEKGIEVRQDSVTI
jgi:hypothetical protein